MNSGQKPTVVPRLEQGVFAVWCEDDPTGAAEIRDAALEGHLAYIEDHFDRYLAAGPMRAGDENTISGSLLIIRAETEADARALIEGDPYVQTGLYARIKYRRLTPAAGAWLGGVIWDSAESLRAVASSQPNAAD